MLRTQLLWIAILPAAIAAGCGKNEPGTGGGGSGGEGGTAAIDACANVEALRASCEALPDRFDVSTTLAKGCYKASKSPILVDGVTLTLSPGVTILFAEDTGIELAGGTQVLVAAGTPQEPICLTGDTAKRGAWSGISLGRTEGESHALAYVTIEYGGSTKSDKTAAAVKLVSDSRAVRLSLTHSTIRESQGYGLDLIASAEAPAFEGNTFTKNTLGPAIVDSDVAGLLDAGSTYTGNDVDEIAVRTNRVQKNATWASLGVPYHLLGNLQVDVPWTITAPSTLVMAKDTWISIDGDDAGLRALGTADEPIVFTGEQKVRGFWDSLRFGGTNNAANELAHVTVEYAGSTKHDADNAAIKATADSHGVTLSLSSCILHESQGFGLYLEGSATVPAISGNTFTGNGLGPLSVGSQVAHVLETSSTYTGNDVDHIRVRGDRVGKTVTWRDLGVPYEFEQSLHVDGVWTLAPGVTLLLPKHGWIGMSGDAAALHAVGTADRPITITGVEKTPGFWHSLIFDTTLNGANEIDHATIENGGSDSGAGEAGMITATSDSHGVALSVKNSTIRGSAQYGIYLGKYAQYNADIASSNLFSGNAAGDVFKDQ